MIACFAAVLISFANLFLFPKMDAPTLGEMGSSSPSRRLVSALWMSQATRKESNRFWFADHTELRGYEAKDQVVLFVAPKVLIMKQWHWKVSVLNAMHL